MRATREVIFRKMTALCVAAAMGVLSACAAPSSYMGIDISSAPAEPSRSHPISREPGAGQQLVALYRKAQALDCPLMAERDKTTEECFALGQQMLAKAKQARAERLAGRIFLLGSRLSMQQLSLSALARRAQGGDKLAQLELDIRFEEGRGVPVDLKKARKLYSKAAKDSGGTVMVYSPPVGNGASGRVIPVSAGPKQYGLAEAKRRLEELQ